MASRVLPPVPPAERNRRQGRLSGPCHERALRRPGPRSLPTRSPSGAPLLTTTRHRYAAGPICSVQFSVRYPGAPSPFVRDGVVMPLRDSCTSALSPALLSQARGSISSRTQAAGVSAATRIIMSLYRGLRRLSPRPLVGFGWRRGLRRVRGPSPNCSGCQNCRWIRLATRWISPSPIADGWASSSTATARRKSCRKRWSIGAANSVSSVISASESSSGMGLSEWREGRSTGHNPNRNTPATPRLSLRRASWHGQRWGYDLPPTRKLDGRGRDAVAASSVPATSCSKRPDAKPRSWRHHEELPRLVSLTCASAASMSWRIASVRLERRRSKRKSSICSTRFRGRLIVVVTRASGRSAFSTMAHEVERGVKR
jgi:hypothetical protein